MAEETTQQQTMVAQPMQPQQPAKVFNLDSITIKGTDIYGKMKPFSQNPRDYNSDKMAGEQYYLYRYFGAIITVPTDFHRDYQAHEILEVTLTGTVRTQEVPDPNSPAGKKLVETQSYSYDGHLTTTDEIAMLKLAKHRTEIQRATKTIQKIDVAKEMSEEDLKDLLGKV